MLHATYFGMSWVYFWYPIVFLPKSTCFWRCINLCLSSGSLSSVALLAAAVLCCVFAAGFESMSWGRPEMPSAPFLLTAAAKTDNVHI